MPNTSSKSTRPRDPVPPESELIGRRDAAERARVHYNTIRLWENAGHLDPIKIKVGRRDEVRYRIAQLDEVAAAQADKRALVGNRSAALELPTDRLWEMVQEAGDRATEALEHKARAEVRAAQLVEELERAERRHAGELERHDRAQGEELERAEARARDAEDRAAQLQEALIELARPGGGPLGFLFRRRPIVILPGGRRELGPGDTVEVPAEEPPG